MYYKDHSYFSVIGTEEKAYFLGLLYADGWITSNSRVTGIELHERDHDILKQFSQAIFGLDRTRYRKPFTRTYNRENGKSVVINAAGRWVVSISDSLIVEQLKRLGMTSKKSATHGFPTDKQVPEHLVRHFLRGYFDGDGCLTSVLSQGATRWRVEMLSSRAFGIALQALVLKLLAINVTFARTRCNITSTTIGGNRQVKKFMDWIYADAKVCLPRKRAIYEKLCADIERIDSKLKYSRYRNITFDKRRNRWNAVVRVNKRSKHLTGFLTEEAAYLAQQAAIAKTEVAMDL